MTGDLSLCYIFKEELMTGVARLPRRITCDSGGSVVVPGRLSLCLNSQQD